MPVTTAIAVATLKVMECSGARGALARRIISTRPVLGTPAALGPVERGDRSGEATPR
jgi:hypothetical protein